MITVELPPTFYYDHVARGLPAGTVVRVKAKTVVVEATVAELVEILNDAKFHVAQAEAGHWDDPERLMFGMIGSARATVRRLQPVIDSLDPTEVATAVAEAERVEREQIAAERERREANAERDAAERAARAERAAAELAAHPRLATIYNARFNMPSNVTRIVGLKDDTDLKVGAILVTPTLRTYEITELGEPRHGDFPATIRDRDGVEYDAKIEVQVIHPRSTS